MLHLHSVQGDESRSPHQVQTDQREKLSELETLKELQVEIDTRKQNRCFKSTNVLNLQHGSSVFRFSTSVGANNVDEDRLSRE